MRLSRPATLVALIAIGSAFACWQSNVLAQEIHIQPAEKIIEERPLDCHVTLPSDGSFVPLELPLPIALGADQFWFGTEKLWTRLPTDGVWRGSVPRERGDFVYEDKSFWFRAFPGFSEDAWFTITGKRLDGPAPAFTETYYHYASDQNEDNIMIVGGMSIPVFGCWRITARYADQELGFTVWVTPLSDQQPLTEGSPSAISRQQSVPALRRVHVDGEKQERLLVYRVVPEIPHEAQVLNVSGTVVLHAIIRSGRPSELAYVSGPPLLAQVAIDAVTWWRYMVITNEPTEIDTTINVVVPASN